MYNVIEAENKPEDVAISHVEINDIRNLSLSIF